MTDTTTELIDQALNLARSLILDTLPNGPYRIGTVRIGSQPEQQYIVPRGWEILNTERWCRTSELAMVLSDLDRCEHGRHAPDSCNECGGRSHGNTFMPPAGTRIGTTMYGLAIVVPPERLGWQRSAWIEGPAEPSDT